LATVVLPRSLVALFPGAERRYEVEGSTVADIVDALNERLPGLRNRVVDAGPVLREHLNVFVAGQRADLSTAVPAGETVHIIPAVSGGAHQPNRRGTARWYVRVMPGPASRT
jgi:molybdopterin converting factor small subunit